MVDLRSEPITNIDKATHSQDGWVSRFFGEDILFPIISPDKHTQDVLIQRTTMNKLAQLVAQKASLTSIVNSLVKLVGLDLPNIQSGGLVAEAFRIIEEDI